MNKDELKPCPFCGSEPTSSDEFDDEVLLYGCTKDLDCPMCDAPFVNLADWNTRPIEDALQARIAELEAAQKEALDCDDAYYQAARTAILEFAKTSHMAAEDEWRALVAEAQKGNQNV